MATVSSNASVNADTLFGHQPVLAMNSTKYEVCGIRFSIWTEEDKRRLSSVEIYDDQTYSSNSQPTDHGCMSHFLGTCSTKYLCKTCRCTNTCPGHYGRIRLSRPMFQPASLLNKWTPRLLRLVCFMCAKCLVNQDTTRTMQNRKPSVLFGSVDKLKVVKECPGCGSKQPKYSVVDRSISVTWSPGFEFSCPEEEEWCRRPFTAARCLQLARRADNDLLKKYTGVDAPLHDALVIQSILIPPVQIRPSTVVKGQKQDNDLTTIINKIVKRNNVLRKIDEGGRAETVAATRCYNQLCGFIFSFISKDVSSTPLPTMGRGRQTAAKGKVGLAQMIEGKEGLFRKSLCGKRTNSGARTVILPDPTLDLNEVRMPEDFAVILSKPITVGNDNYEDLQDRVRVGEGVLGGVESVVKQGSGDTISLRSLSREDREEVAKGLVNGDVVHRHLKDGDWICLGRQPSLHKYNMIGVKILIKRKTDPNYSLAWEFNPGLCKAKNADFDGDEEHCIVPQSIVALAEVQNLMNVENNSLHYSTNTPVYVPMQDTILGAYQLTSGIRLPVRNFCDMVATIRYPRRPMPHVATVADPVDGKVDGRRVFDYLIPPTTHYAHAGVTIVNGQITGDSAPLSTKHIGSKHHSLLTTLALDCSPPVMTQFVADLSRVVYVLHMCVEAMSTGMVDLVLEGRYLQDYRRAVAKARYDYARASTDAGELVALAGCDATAVAVLRRSDTYRQRFNGVHAMTTCGSKGQPRNAAQLMMCVGTQIIGDGRMKMRGGRCFPCFSKYDRSPESRGFCGNSYREGLPVGSYFFHATAGRDGVVNTHCVTPDAGYLYRKLYKNTNSVTLYYGGSVRFGEKCEVMCLYFDGCAPENLERVEAPSLFTPRTGDPCTEWLRATLATSRQKCGDPICRDDVLWVPVNLDRVFGHTLPTGAGADGGGEDMVGRVEVRDYCNQLLAMRQFQMLQQAYHLAEWTLRSRVSVALFHRVREETTRRIHRAAAPAGTALGGILASAFGAPTAQNPLSSFHHTGDKLATGTDRLKRLLALGREKNGVRKPYLFTATVRPRVLGLARNRKALQAVVAGMVAVPLHQLLPKNRNKGAAVATRVVLDVESGALGHPGCLPPAVILGAELFERLKKEGGRLVAVRFDLCPEAIQDKQVTITSIVRGVEASVKHDEDFRVWAPSLASETPCLFVSGCMPGAQFIDNTIVGGHPAVRHVKVVPDSEEGCFVVKAITNSAAPFFTVDSVWDVESFYADCPLVMEDLYDVDVCQNTLAHELHTVVAAGGHINKHHPYLLAAIACQSGRYLKMDRFGLPRGVSDPLQRASFEEATKVLSGSAIIGDEIKDIRSSMSAALIMGVPTRNGTGIVKLMMQPATASLHQPTWRKVAQRDKYRRFVVVCIVGHVRAR
jgi:DNA-directed RNA polymerase beta' subunit